jgi:alpha-D-ribose 1-methylphosphonate 5-triphosphate synthase subunit PhnH
MTGEEGEPPPKTVANSNVFRLDPVVRDHVADSIAEFVRHLDAASARPIPENLERLGDAADNLMRATASVLIELRRASEDGTGSCSP